MSSTENAIIAVTIFLFIHSLWIINLLMFYIMSILGLNSVLFRGKFCSVDNQFSILDLFGQIYV